MAVVAVAVEGAEEVAVAAVVVAVDSKPWGRSLEGRKVRDKNRRQSTATRRGGMKSHDRWPGFEKGIWVLFGHGKDQGRCNSEEYGLMKRLTCIAMPGVSY